MEIADSKQLRKHQRGYVEMSTYQVVIPSYKQKINIHLWLFQGPMKRLIGKKILTAIENYRKANIYVLNGFKPLGNNKERNNPA